MNIKQTKLLVPGYLTNYIYPLLLQKNRQDTLFGTKIDNVYSLMDDSDYKKESKESIIFKVHNILKENKDSFNVFNKVLENIDFINQFISFYTECFYYEVDISNLPQNSDEEKEIYKIISLIDSLNLGIRENYNNYLNNLKDHEVVTDFYSQFIEHKLLSKAIDNGCTRYDCDYVFFENPKKLYKKATTRSKELDDICEFIMDNNDKTIQVVSPKDVYLDDIARVFGAYKIPFRRINYKADSVVVRRIIDFVEFLRKKDLNSLLLVLRFDEENKDLCDYMEHFNVEVEELLKPFGRFSNIDYSKIKELDNKYYKETDKAEKEKIYIERNQEIYNLEQKHPLLEIIDYSKTKPMIILEKNAEKTRQSLEEIVGGWLNDDPYKSLSDYYNKLVSRFDWENEYAKDLSCFSSAGRLIKESQRNNGDLDILSELLKNIKSGDEKTTSNVVTVSDMDHLLPGKDITIVIGAIEGAFLPTLEKNGIIKEDYVSRVTNYPSLSERLNFSKLKMDCLKRISPMIVLSYCYSDYSGSEKKLSSYIENTFEVDEKLFKERKIEEEYNYYKIIDKTLSKENAEGLFVKDGGIKGSVTSLEQYQNCPYSYFLQRGLGISELQGYQKVDASVLGTLRHKIFEILGKNNFEKPEELDELLDKYIGAIEEIYSSDKDELRIQKEMIGDILKLNEDIAKGLKNSDDYVCVEQEYRLDNERVDADKYHFNFTAIVDRIDENNDYYRIIDYKSSQQVFNVNQFLNGTQLQLMVYLWLLWKKGVLKKNPQGIFYFNLSLESDYQNLEESITAFNDAQIESAAFLKKNQLQGWYMLDKKEREKNRNPYLRSASLKSDLEYDITDIEEVDRFLNLLFEQIANNIASGKMDATPSTKGCQYCKYSSICHKEEFETSEEDLATE